MAEGLIEIDIKEKLKELKDKGFVKSLRKDNTGIGYTLETMLGIKENNLGEPDLSYNGIPVELKAQRIDASSRVTLFTKVPHWSPLSAKQIIEKYGYKDIKGRKALKTTLKVDGFNEQGFKLELDEENNKLNIVHKEGGVVSFFKIEELMAILKKKLHENLLMVLAFRKMEKDGEYFNYSSAILLTKMTEKAFELLLKEGLMVWEFRMDIRERTQGKGNFFVRDHGPGFRLSRNHLDKLYEKKEIIL
ncbi:MAG: MvaI/BcnI family restriction endonuclease [archaeon]